MDYQLEALRYKISTGIDLHLDESGILESVSCKPLSKIVFPEFITKVHMTGQQSIDIESSIQEVYFLGNIKLFYWRVTFANLRKVYFKHVEEIKQMSFCYDFKLKEFIVDGGLRVIWYSAFSKCMALKYFDFKCMDVTNKFRCTVMDNAFESCGSLSELKGFENLERVDFGKCCFSSCTSLETLILPDKCNFGSECFSRCSGLKRVVIKNFEYIANGGGRYLFRGCRSDLVFEIYNVFEDKKGMINRVLGSSNERLYFENITIHEERYNE